MLKLYGGRNHFLEKVMTMATTICASSPEDVLAALENVNFPGSTPEDENRSMRTLLEQAAPLVMKGTIRSVQQRVTEALAVPLSADKEYRLQLIFALQDAWPYVHWSSTLGPIPAHRQRMRDLYRAMWDANDDGKTPS